MAEVQMSQRTGLGQVSIAIVCLSFIFASCKPKESDAGLAAIVGSENGQNKAMAFVALRNAVDIKDSIPENANGKAALNMIYETYYGLVECSDLTVKGKHVPADTWMNMLEFYAFSQVLYLDKDRRLLVYDVNGSDRTPIYFPSCGVLGKNLLTLPMLLAADAQSPKSPKHARVLPH